MSITLDNKVGMVVLYIKRNIYVISYWLLYWLGKYWNYQDIYVLISLNISTILINTVILFEVSCNVIMTSLDWYLKRLSRFT